MNERFVDGADVLINKGGFAIDQWELYASPEAEVQDGIFKHNLDLPALAEKYGLKSGDYVFVSNQEVKNDNSLRFIVK